MARRVTHIMPRVVPKCCWWIDSSVLGAKSIVDDEFVKYFCDHHEFCVNSTGRVKYQVTSPSSEDRACYAHPLDISCIFVYESIFTKIGIRDPFTEFQIEGFIRAFEVVCREFGCPTSLNVFLYLFKLTKPFGKDKQQWLSLRAHQGRDFRFPLSWNEDWVIPKVERKDLSESELLLVDALSEYWGKKDNHLPTRLLLTQTSSYIQKQILGIMSRRSNAYDRFKAHLLNKSKKTVITGGSTSEASKAISPEVVPPTSSVASDSSSARDTSATPSPSIVSAQEIDNRNKELQQARKRKNPKPKYGYINSKEFNHVGFAQEYLVGGNNKIPMDGENFLRNLDFVTRNCIKAAAICQAAQNKVRGSVLVPEGEVEQLRVRVKAVETEKRVIEGEKFELSSKVSKLEARLAVKSQDLNAVREALKKSEKERS
ncbi:hypothetical protein PIB30_076302 [Stylosanthes scabra]|uniref:Transposase (Putative), gypsy type n=1 Tax=Stylosanthes scabra TaxID=79078 RepID=A0ABU6ZNW2_9FABA|nr:hypothetical protein [Stylosanthes scabra]